MLMYYKGLFVWTVLFYIAFIGSLTLVRGMYRKTERGYDPASMRPDKRLRHNTMSLLADNTVPASRVQEIINDAEAAGAANVADLVGSTTKNSMRGLRRRYLKHSAWPGLYTEGIRCWNTKTNQEEVMPMHFLLPHELVALLVRVGDKQRLLETDGMDPKTLQHLRECEGKAGESLLAIGLWGDGAPCNWDRTESLEVFSINFPGLTG